MYHTFGTIAGTKINYPGIRHKKQIQGVNNKPSKNFELKKTFKSKEREVFQALQRTMLLFHDFSAFHFFLSF